MPSLIQCVPCIHPPEAFAKGETGRVGTVLLKGHSHAGPEGRYSILASHPFLTFRCWGATSQVISESGEIRNFYGNPWRILEDLLSRFEILEDGLEGLPTGGCFGYLGYELGLFGEPKLQPLIERTGTLPDAELFFFRSLIRFDSLKQKATLVSTGLMEDGSIDQDFARKDLERGMDLLHSSPSPLSPLSPSISWPEMDPMKNPFHSSLTAQEFIDRVKEVQEFIRLGHIYQMNLTQRLVCSVAIEGWDLFQRLHQVSPAPFAAFIQGGSHQIVSSSPELFLKIDQQKILTCPIKGTRPRSTDPATDLRMAQELVASEKERAELVMITDLLRNDLGRICQYGSVSVKGLMLLKHFPQVHHLVSEIQGLLRPGVSHLHALESCFPGGSITGAPKIRAMEIIELMEPLERGPYTGCIGYFGFNRHSQWNIAIRTAICRPQEIFFPVGAGIVSDSVPEFEYEETLAKARGFLRILGKDPSVKILPTDRSRMRSD